MRGDYSKAGDGADYIESCTTRVLSRIYGLGGGYNMLIINYL